MNKSLGLAYAIKRRRNKSKVNETGITPPSERGEPNDDSLMTEQANWAESDLMELDPDIYEESEMDNTEGNADQDSARESVLSRIMRKFRR